MNFVGSKKILLRQPEELEGVECRRQGDVFGLLLHEGSYQLD